MNNNFNDKVRKINWQEEEKIKRSICVDIARKLLQLDITKDERKKLEWSLRCLLNPNSDTNNVVLASSLIKILDYQYDLKERKNSKKSFKI